MSTTVKKEANNTSTVSNSISYNNRPPNSKKDRPIMLTTIDNPYNPFTQWDEWLKFDRDQGYYTNEYLASTVLDDDSLSDEQTLQAIKEAMRYISETNPTGIWVIRYKNSDS